MPSNFLVIKKKIQLYQRRLEWVKQLQFNTKIRSDKKTYKSYHVDFVRDIGFLFLVFINFVNWG